MESDVTTATDNTDEDFAAGTMPAILEMRQSIPGLWECANEIYHADKEYLTHSMLEDFKLSIPYFYEKHIAGTIVEEPTPAMGLGTVVHAFVLEPNEAEGRFLVYPEGDGRTTAVKEARQRVATEARKTGKTVVTAAQWETAERMRDSAWDRERHPAVVEILEMEGLCEQSVKCEDETWGKRKVRFDKLFPAGHGLNLKTTRALGPDAFGRQAFNLGYHRETAHYQDCLDLIFGEGLGRYLYIAIWNEPPFDTIVYEMDVADQALGRRDNHRLMIELAKRRKADDWTSRWKGLVPLRLPRYAHQQADPEGDGDEE